jgi:metal-sulfur cluster biosynthetic enzyme
MLRQVIRYKRKLVLVRRANLDRVRELRVVCLTLTMVNCVCLQLLGSVKIGRMRKEGLVRTHKSVRTVQIKNSVTFRDCKVFLLLGAHWCF